jgi:hypothetical protein
MTNPENSRHVEVRHLPEVQASSRLKAAVPLGDSELLERLRQRTRQTSARPAGSTALVEAAIPPEDQPGAEGEEPRGGSSG